MSRSAGPGCCSVQVWDKSVTKAVEVAIRDSGLGLNPQAEGQVIRVPLPPLTQERRNDLVKPAGKYAEATKVAIRGVRRDGMEQIKALEKDKKAPIGEDDAKRWSDEVQKLTDQYIKQVDDRPGRQGKGHQAGLTPGVRRHAAQRAGRAPRPSRPAGGAAGACRHHHGRQPALGRGARPAASRSATRPAPRRCAAPSRPAPSRASAG